MPKISEEDRLFAERLANVLRELRMAAGWTQAEAEAEIGVAPGKVGRWERATHPPKGYDLGRAYRAYQPFGADWEWFFDPPEIVITNPVRYRLDELAAAGTIEAGAAAKRAAARRRLGASRPVAERGKRLA